MDSIETFFRETGALLPGVFTCLYLVIKIVAGALALQAPNARTPAVGMICSAAGTLVATVLMLLIHVIVRGQEGRISQYDAEQYSFAANLISFAGVALEIIFAVFLVVFVMRVKGRD